MGTRSLTYIEESYETCVADEKIIMKYMKQNKTYFVCIVNMMGIPVVMAWSLLSFARL